MTGLATPLGGPPGGVTTARHLAASPTAAARWSWRWYVLLGLAAAAGTAMSGGSGVRTAVMTLVSGCGAVAVALGVMRYRPATNGGRWLGTGWWLIAAALAATPATVALAGLPHPGARLIPYPLFVAGLLLVARRGRRRPWYDVVLDAGILGLGLGSIAWSLVAQPLLAATTLSESARTAAVTLLGADVVVLAAVARFMLVTSVRTGASILLSTAGLIVLVADAAQLVAIAGTDSRAAAFAGALRVAAATFIAAAALHPSMAEPPRDAWPRYRGRLAVFLLLAPLTPVLVAAGALIADRAHRPYVLADALIPTALGGVQSLLLVVRLGVTAGVARRRSRALARQARELSRRTEELTSALYERERLQQRLDFHVSHDALTGLPNRALLTARVGAVLDAGAHAHLVLLDVDRFADVNDAHGHHVGDELLEHVAGRLHALLAPGDTLARLGADQFAMLLAGDVHRAGEISGAALEALRRPYVVDGRTLRVSGSAGLLALAQPSTPTDALRDADAALQEAKRGGGNRMVVFAPELRSARQDHTRLALGLRDALAFGEFSLAFQPLVALTDRRVRAVETLLRWSRADGEVVSPSVFVPVAEQTGLIWAIGAWVLNEACRQARSWYIEHGVTVSVNVSAHQLRDGRFPTLVADALHASGLPGRGLVLEVTESALVAAGAEESALVRERLDRIRELGVRIAIDDFGTGYSSLAYLRELPAEILKVDRAFVRGDALHGGSDRAFLRAILQLASSVRMQTVAEGVETEEQARLLRMLGYPLAQGFLFHRPQSADAITELLKS